MRKIVLEMQSGLYAAAVQRVLIQEMEDCQVVLAHRPDQMPDCCRQTAPDALLLEVTAYPGRTLPQRLALCRAVRAEHPACKLVILVDDVADRALAQAVKQAKAEGEIDLFIYTSASANFLTALMETV